MAKADGIGRPKKIPTPQWLKEQGDAYIKGCAEQGKVPHLSGLCAQIGITRVAYFAYSRGDHDTDKDDYSGVAEMIRQHIEGGKLDALYTGKVPASIGIFDLKNNHGWKDQTAVDHTTGGRPIVVSKDEFNL